VSRTRPDSSQVRSTLALAFRSLLAALWFAFAFFVLLPGCVLWLSGASLAPPPGANRLLGVLVIAASQLALLPPIIDFVRRGRGTHAPFDPPHRFVTAGPYRCVRNPMYLLYVVVMLGETILYRSWPLLAYAAGFWLLAHVYVVGVEEKELARRFGAEYEDYCRRVPRWLPRAR
jgi:protein-S-isoprenylcysteine O-methyltransferase Ste14